MADKSESCSTLLPFHIFTNTKKMQLSKHNRLQRKEEENKKEVKKAKRRCSGRFWVLLYKAASQRRQLKKTHRVATDAPAVTLWIPLRLFYKMKQKKNTRVTSLSLKTTIICNERILENTPIGLILTTLIATGGEYGCNVLILESTRRLLHIPTRLRGHLLQPTFIINLYMSNRWNTQHLNPSC